MPYQFMKQGVVRIGKKEFAEGETFPEELIEKSTADALVKEGVVKKVDGKANKSKK